ncbi:MAG: tetratricopeptide repeat protein [Cryomorphaceae bacterium]|jgi:tetratricopeptide (TPR) repeat protein|nr:tetratricopeptide repeat protein [Cryomorphaceae bacterium]
MRKILVILFLLNLYQSFGQGETDQQLAQYYYTNGEFEKARTYYEKLYSKDPGKFHFNRLLECLTQSGDVKEAEKLIKKQIAGNKTNNEYKVILAVFYEDQKEEEKAAKIYTALIDEMLEDPSQIISLYDVFRSKNRTDMALKVLEKGRKLLKDGYPLNIQFAEIYGASGETDKMLAEYMNLLELNSGYLETVQTILARQIDFTVEDNKAAGILRTILLERNQKNPNKTIYYEMLIWYYIQKKNFSGALTQAKALDKKLGEQGLRVMELGKVCIENNAYENARDAFKYVTQLGEDKLYYYQAESALLNARFLEITNNRNYSKEELELTIQEYRTVAQRLGKRKTVVPVNIELSHILAFYANEPKQAIELLNFTLTIPGLTDMQKAETKMKLADVHVLSSDIWEASLLYMQIEADFKFEPIGHEAKFKNARIFYYDGEFDFAQSQLSVLKESTSKLIANDALQLSLLITDNFGLDSNYTVMTWFANADLLIEQHRYKEAFDLYDSINKAFPYHSLSDEIFYRKGLISEQQGLWEQAVTFYESLLKYHREDILADDALFHLAEIQEKHLNNKEKASEYYKTILFDFKGSLYAIESRKRLRLLRGDTLDESDIP